MMWASLPGVEENKKSFKNKKVTAKSHSHLGCTYCLKKIKNDNLDSEFGISIFDTFSVIFRLNCDFPVISCGGNQNTLGKPLPNPKSLYL